MLIHIWSQGLGSYGCMPLDRLLLDITSSLFYNQLILNQKHQEQNNLVEIKVMELEAEWQFSLWRCCLSPY